MLTLICPQISKRLEYICEIVFAQLLHIPYHLRIAAEYIVDPQDIIIDYGNQITSSVKKLTIPDVGLLFQDGISPQSLEIHEEELPLFFHFPTQQSDALSFDIFSAAFYLITEYEKYVARHIDSHGRYLRNDYQTDSLHLDELPLVHLYAEKLRKALQILWPDLKKTPKLTFKYEITIDVDNPWKYLNKGMVLSVGGLLKQMYQGDISGAIERLKAIYIGKDPNDTFEDIYQLCPPEKTTFFFLINRESPHDGRFTLTSKAYQKLIKEICGKGYNVGIHPSYTSFLDGERLKEEKKALEHFIDLPIHKSRQHFLKYRLPYTFRELEALGIKEEYSICHFEKGGFPTGMAAPYLWYDLEEERISELKIHPTIIMDWTLVGYMKLSPWEALARTQKWIEQCKEVGGEFILLIHNESLSESGMWNGWGEVIRKILYTLTENLKSA